MKKIASDRNYRIFKRASGPNALERLMWIDSSASQKGAPPGTAYLIFQALLSTALVKCEKENLESPQCEDDLEYLLTLTNDAVGTMEKFKDVWAKYLEGMYSNMKTLNPKAAEEVIRWLQGNKGDN